MHMWVGKEWFVKATNLLLFCSLCWVKIAPELNAYKQILSGLFLLYQLQSTNKMKIKLDLGKEMKTNDKAKEQKEGSYSYYDQIPSSFRVSMCGMSCQTCRGASGIGLQVHKTYCFVFLPLCCVIVPLFGHILHGRGPSDTSGYIEQITYHSCNHKLITFKAHILSTTLSTLLYLF